VHDQFFEQGANPLSALLFGVKRLHAEASKLTVPVQYLSAGRVGRSQSCNGFFGQFGARHDSSK
jgi:hypothetical protein